MKLSASIILRSILAPIVIFGFLSTAHANDSTREEFRPLDPRAYNYDKMLELARSFLTGKRGDRVQKEFLQVAFAEELKISDELQQKFGFPEKFKEMSVQQFILLLQQNPEKWQMLEEILKDIPNIIDPSDPLAVEKSRKAMASIHSLVEGQGVLEEFQKYNDPSLPFLLQTPNKTPGYSNLKLYANHPRRGLNGRKYPAIDLVAKLKSAMSRKYVKQISGNTYEFDIPELAEALIDLHRQGKEVHWGVHRDIHSERGLKVLEMFRDAGFEIVDQKAESQLSEIEQKILRESRVGKSSFYLVNSVGLNHTKMFAINWDYPKTAKVFYLSGNFTISGLHKHGDLGGTGHSDPSVVPNANHLVSMKSHALAVVTRHQMEMIFDLGLRGKELPFSGIYEVRGKQHADGTYPSIYLTFAPSGGYGDINEHFISRAIKEAKGPISMTQFTFSSQSVEDALFEYAVNEKALGREFIYWGIGDKSPSLREWSKFLSISGIEQIRDENLKYYQIDADNKWVTNFPGKELEVIQSRILVAPDKYPFIRFVKLPDGSSVETSAKIHHKNAVFGGAKIISDEEAKTRKHYNAADGNNYALTQSGFAILGNSFNFGEAAQGNNEQALAFLNNPRANAFGWSIFFGLAEDSPRSVAKEALIRNQRNPKTAKKLNCRSSF